MSERIWLADPNMREGLLATLRNAIPGDWSISSEPSGCTAALTENSDIDAAELTALAPRLRLIAKLDTGSARIRGEGARVLLLPNAALTGVAEHAVAMILALIKNLQRVNDATRDRRWLQDRAEPILTDQQRYTYNWIGTTDFGTVYRKKVGIVGFGKIGRAVAARLRPFGVKLMYFQRHRLSVDDELKFGVSWRELDDLLSEADVVTLHHRFQEGDGGNDGQFDRPKFTRMKKSALFINTARGRLVNEDDLAAALLGGVIAGAALDVFRYEPLPDDHVFFSVPPHKLLLTPHVAGAPIDEAWRLAIDDLLEALKSTPNPSNRALER